jgi:hypothetical protein
MQLFFPAAVWLDNYPLTDQGRAPLQITRDERSVVNELATGLRKKYFKAVKHTFSMNWMWLPDSESDTIDGGLGRLRLKELVRDGESTRVLTVYDRDGGVDSYTVWTNSYEETLIRRDPSSGRHFWSVSVEFEEQ